MTLMKGTTVSMPWFDDTLALLQEADEQIEALKALHDEALGNSNVRSRFKTRIKGVLENQRSALDYLAVGLTNEVGSPKGSIYFPLAQSDDEFDTHMEGRMPGVAAAAPHIADAIRQHQPYHPGNEWLRNLSRLTRQQKHNRLTLQVVREVYQCRVTERATGAFVQWHGVRFEVTCYHVTEKAITVDGRIMSVGGVIEVRPEPDRDPDAPKLFEVGVGPSSFQVFGVPIDPETQQPIPDDRLNVESGPLHQWCFIDPHKPILDGLRGFQSGVVAVVRDVTQAGLL